MSQEALLYTKARVNRAEKELCALWGYWGYSEVTAVYARCCTSCLLLYSELRSRF